MKLKSFAQVLCTFLLISGTLLICLPQVVWAGMSSTNYKIWADSLNLFGDEDSTSTNYALSDTGGELGTGEMSSANYNASIGYWGMIWDPTIIFSIADTAIDFGTLSSQEVKTDTTTFDVATNGWQGYVVTVRGETGLKDTNGYTIAGVAAGTVTAGVEEYGISTSGRDGQINSTDEAITTTPTTVAAYNSFTDTITTTVTFKVAITDMTEAGNYSQNLAFVATGRF
jgi:hypothetical protein